MAIVYSLSKEPKTSATAKDDEAQRSTPPPSNLAITPGDRNRSPDEQPPGNDSTVVENTTNQDYDIPPEYQNARTQNNVDGVYSEDTPLLRQYAESDDYEYQQEQTMYVRNWGGGASATNTGRSGSNSQTGQNNLASLLAASGGSDDNQVAAALSNANNAYQKQNSQAAKKKFLADARERADNGLLLTARQNPISPFTITAGSIIPITMVTGINSDLPGDIVGQVNRNVYDSVTGNYLLIPAGSKVVGKYDSGVTWGQKRVLVVWSRLVFPDGSSIDLRGMQGIDLDGFSGYNDKVDAHVGEIIGITLASTLLSIGTGQLSTLAGQQSNEFLQSLTQAVSGGAQSGAGIIDQIAKKIVNLQPTLKNKER